MYILVVRIAGSGTSDMLRRAMGNIKYRVKSTASRGSNTEIAMEVYIPNSNMAFVEKLRAVDGVEDVTAIQYNGNIMTEERICRKYKESPAEKQPSKSCK